MVVVAPAENRRKGHLPIGFGEADISATARDRLRSISLMVSPSRNFTSMLSKPPANRRISQRRQMNVRSALQVRQRRLPHPHRLSQLDLRDTALQAQIFYCCPKAANGVSSALRRFDFMRARLAGCECRTPPYDAQVISILAGKSHSLER